MGTELSPAVPPFRVLEHTQEKWIACGCMRMPFWIASAFPTVSREEVRSFGVHRPGSEPAKRSSFGSPRDPPEPALKRQRTCRLDPKRGAARAALYELGAPDRAARGEARSPRFDPMGTEGGNEATDDVCVGRSFGDVEPGEKRRKKGLKVDGERSRCATAKYRKKRKLSQES